MTCLTPFIDAGVVDRQQLLALAHLLDNPAPASGRAATTAPTQSNGARGAMIAKRAARLPFPTQRARQRYIDRHSQPCSGEA